MSRSREEHINLAQRALNGHLLETFTLGVERDTEFFRIVDSEKLSTEHFARRALAKQRKRLSERLWGEAKQRPGSLDDWYEMGRILHETPATWLGREESVALGVYLLCSAKLDFRASLTVFSQHGPATDPHYFLVVGTAQHEIFRFPDKLGRGTFVVDPWAASILVQRTIEWNPSRLVEALEQRPDVVVDPAGCAYPEAGRSLVAVCYKSGTRFH